MTFIFSRILASHSIDSSTIEDVSYFEMAGNVYDGYVDDIFSKEEEGGKYNGSSLMNRSSFIYVWF